MFGALALGAPTPSLDSAGSHAVAERIRAAADRIGKRLEGSSHD